MRYHAACVGLKPRFCEGDEFRLEPESEADERTVTAARNAARDEFGPRTRRKDFTPCGGAGLHAIRVAARVKALQLRPHRARGGRKDSEGLEQADVEALSHPTWKKWVKSLDEDDRRCLRIWRGGAIYTPTRRYSSRAGQSEDVRAACSWCGHTRASARHFWQDCVHYEAIRCDLEVEYGIPKVWWRRQPRCTSKTGWITLSAARDAATRAAMQVAACRLGIAIVRSCRPSEGGVATEP